MNSRKLPRSLLAIPFLTDVAGMLLIFAVSRSMAETGASLAVLGFIGAGHAAAASVSSFVAGPLSDRFGRARLIVPGMLVLLAVSLVSAIVETGGAVSLAAYWTSALSLGMIHPATIAWFNTGERAGGSQGSQGISGNLVRFCISWNLGILVAQSGGGALYLLGPRPLFVAAGLVSALDLILAVRVGRVMSHRRTDRRAAESRESDGFMIETSETRAGLGSIGEAGDRHDLATDRMSATFVRLAWLANLGGAVAVSMVLHLFPRLAVGLGIESDLHGAILAGMRVVAIAVYLVLHRTGFWQYRFAANSVVQLTAMGGLLVVFFAGTAPMLLLGLSGIALLMGFNYFSGIYYGSSGHEEERRGFASGMHEATLGLGIAVGSAAGGLIGTVAGDRSPYLFAAGVIMVLYAIEAALFLRNRRFFAESSGTPAGVRKDQSE